MVKLFFKVGYWILVLSSSMVNVYAGVTRTDREDWPPEHTVEARGPLVERIVTAPPPEVPLDNPHSLEQVTQESDTSYNSIGDFFPPTKMK